MGSRIDELYSFRLAKVEDVNAVMAFIHEEWSPNHILGYDKELFLWQYGRDEYGDKESINIVLMIRKDGSIAGMIGFVPYSEERDRLHISTAITKVSRKETVPMLGVELMKKQVELVGEKANFASGTNPRTILPIFEKVFRHKTGIMQQYYMLNTSCEDYHLAIPDFDEYDGRYKTFSYKMIEIKTFEELALRFDLRRSYSNMSYKSSEYINKRFFKHPIYRYKTWLVYDDSEKAVGVIFGREIEAEDAKVLRIVDYRGDPRTIQKLGKPLHNLLEDNGYEYIELFVSDMSDYDMMEAGFNLLNTDGKTVIPHYFEPFMRKNVTIYYQSNYDGIIFNADGDQDRPNSRNGGAK